MESLQIFMEFRTVMMEPLVCGAAATQQAYQRQGNQRHLLKEYPHCRLLPREVISLHVLCNMNERHSLYRP
jgi:hypothetical protein